MKRKPALFQRLPRTPNFTAQAKDAVKYDGLPPLKPRRARRVLFLNVKNVWEKDISEQKIVRRAVENLSSGQYYSVLVADGKLECISPNCEGALVAGEYETIDLNGGSLNPGLLTYGSQAGLEEIRAEKSTNDGNVLQPLSDKLPSVLGGDSSVIRAVDGLSFGGRDLLYVIALSPSIS
jgi:hypothetical protein